MVNLQKIQKASEIILSHYKSEYSSEEYKNTPGYEISEFISEDITTKFNCEEKYWDFVHTIYSLSDMESFIKKDLFKNVHEIDESLTQEGFTNCIETILKF